jgi:hypothetical protein
MADNEGNVYMSNDYGPINDALGRKIIPMMTVQPHDIPTSILPQAYRLRMNDVKH